MRAKSRFIDGGFLLAQTTTMGRLLYSKLDKLKNLHCVSKRFLLVRTLGLRRSP